MYLIYFHTLHEITYTIMHRSAIKITWIESVSDKIQRGFNDDFRQLLKQPGIS